MGRLIRILENRTAFILAVSSVLLAAVFFGIGCAAVAVSDRQAAAEASDAMLAAAGRLAEKTSLTDEQIADAFTSRERDTVTRGEQVLSGYGFEAGSGRGAEYLYSRSLLPAFAAGAGVLVCAAFGLTALGIILRGAKRITSAADKKEHFTGSLSDRDLILLAETVNALADDRSRTLEKLSGEKRFLADYLQDFSHQIKTPSAGLMLNNEIYRTHPMQPERQLEYLERDRQCIERINHLCTESLKLARLEADAVSYDIRSCELSSLTEKACAPLYELAAENGTELSVEIPEGMTLTCDGLWLGEAISNLVKNACEHTKNGLVTVTASETPMAVDLYITDNGEGIAESEIPMLFRRFYSRKADRDPSSVGIGMSAAKRIVEDMHGKIYIDTEAGKGTQVRLEFLLLES